MYKSVCALIVLLAVFAFTSGSRSADASPTTPIGPAIVAHAKLANQTAPIPTTTIFTAKTAGLYRMSIYQTLTTANPTSQSCWEVIVNWSDDAGTEEGQTNCVFGSQTLPQAYLNPPFPGQVFTFEVTAGSPVTYSVAQFGASDGTVYSLYYTLERLE
jgi:hypothetical protein